MALDFVRKLGRYKKSPFNNPPLKLNGAREGDRIIALDAGEEYNEYVLVDNVWKKTTIKKELNDYKNEMSVIIEDIYNRLGIVTTFYGFLRIISTTRQWVYNGIIPPPPNSEGGICYSNGNPVPLNVNLNTLLPSSLVITDWNVDNPDLGIMELEFTVTPGSAVRGHYKFTVGSSTDPSTALETWELDIITMVGGYGLNVNSVVITPL